MASKRLTFTKNNFPSGRIMARLLIILILFPVISGAQAPEGMFQKGVQFQKEYKYKEALEIFKALLKQDSANAEILNRVAYLLAYPAYPGKTKEEKEVLYREATRYAEKAVLYSPGSAYSHYHLALALGRLSEYSSLKIKIANAKRIRQSCERAIDLDPSLPGPYHILARWHREVAGFNFVEKAMIATFYSNSLDGGNYDDAVRNFKMAMKLDSNNPIHMYELAVTYYQRDEKTDHQNARLWLNRVIQMKPRSDFDRQVQQKAKKLLEKLD